MNGFTAGWLRTRPVETPPIPQGTPASVIAALLATQAKATQGELLDACREAGHQIDYNGLRKALKRLHQEGSIDRRFEALETSLPILVYSRRTH